MLDQWFKEDLEEKFRSNNRVVLIDPEQNYTWLLESVCKNLNVNYLQVDDFISDLEVKYEIEKNHQNDKVLIHSLFDPMENKRRHYMIQEYVATGATFTKQLNRYIYEKSGLDNTDNKFTKEDLTLAGKMSLKPDNNNIDYWNNLKHAGKKAIFGDYQKSILSFLENPDNFINKIGSKGKKVFYDIIGEYLEMTPEADTSAQVVADELADSIFDNIIYNKPDTKDIYQTWVDSLKYRETLLDYLNKYQLPQDFNPWQVNPNHPFKELDKMWLNEITKLIFNNQNIDDEMIEAIKKRKSSDEGLKIAGSEYWEHIYQLATFEAKPAHEIDDLHQFIELYKKELYKLDQSIRNIQQWFLDNEDIARGFKAIYDEKMRPYLNKWFELFSSYRENQTNYLYNEIFSKKQSNIAVIVGDAISYEISQDIISELKNNPDYEIKDKIVQGNYLSTTANNMSSLFGSIYTNKRETREKNLEDKIGQGLQICELDKIDLEKIDITKPTIIYGSDIDEISEKGDESALKYYKTYIDLIKEQINKLLEAGFAEVHLVTDHGFVCNFNLDEADKFEKTVEGKVNERYILSNEYKVDNDNYVVQEKQVDGYNYVYYPKGNNPIRSRGKYGFSHGGISPQEILLPHLIFKKKSKSNLDVKIANKEQLESISSNNFNIKIKAEETADLFHQERSVIVEIIDGSNNKVFGQTIEIFPGGKEELSLQLNLNSYTIQLLDAESRERLDYLRGEKANIRGGLDGLDFS